MWEEYTGAAPDDARKVFEFDDFARFTAHADWDGKAIRRATEVRVRFQKKASGNDRTIRPLSSHFFRLLPSDFNLRRDSSRRRASTPVQRIQRPLT